MIMSSGNIVIGNRILNYEIEDLDIFSVDYYFDNPRINYIISKYPSEKINNELIEQTLLTKESTRELIHSIKENGGLIEPILVLSGRVIEGNTRLCAYRTLFSQASDEKWKYIKAQVFKDHVSSKEIFTILSNYHIKGKTPWDPYEKAACINKMLEQGQELDEIAKAVGSNKAKVQSMLKAYKAMREKYLSKFDDDKQQTIKSTEEIKKYSYFEALYVNKNLAERAEQTPEFLEEFADWVSEGRIPKAQDVRELHNILDNKKARNKFLGSPTEIAYEEAKESLYWNKPDKVDGFYKKIDQFRELIRETNVNKIKEEVSNNPNMKNVIQLCYKDLRRFCKDIELI
jgi:hypothetical protein